MAPQVRMTATAATRDTRPPDTATGAQPGALRIASVRHR